MKKTHAPNYLKFIPYNGKIADITHADTSKHTVDLATPLSETRTIVAINIVWVRISGTGAMKIYPNEGTQETWCNQAETYESFMILEGSDRLEYGLTVANDDWDLYCLGYVVK